MCADPDHTFFWDTHHPTEFGHAFFAVTLENVIAHHLVRHAHAIGIVDEDHPDAVGLTQPPTHQDRLGVKVLLHRAVEVEVVLCEVCESPNAVLDARQAIERERM